MYLDLFRDKDRDKLSDAIHDAIDSSISGQIDIDVYNRLCPILSKNSISIDNEFFKINKITPSKTAGLSSDELKTVSYLAMFYKYRVKRNVGNVDKYLFLLGYDVDKKPLELLAYEKDFPFNIDNAITFQTYLGLQETNAMDVNVFITVEMSATQVVDTTISTVFSGYIDGFDFMHDIVLMK